MAVSQLSPTQREKFIKAVEAQGGRTRPTRRGLMIYAPDGGTITVHTTYGDYRATKNDIAWFRRHGLIHPEDKQATEEEEVPEVNEEGYPSYITAPINGVTRKTILSELESKGWPLRLRHTDLAMDSTTAARALYAVGYRWDSTEENRRHRQWIAPDDIRELHEKAKAEMDRREQEARDRRHLHAVETDAIRGGIMMHVSEADTVIDTGEPGETTAHVGPPTPKDVLDYMDRQSGSAALQLAGEALIGAMPDDKVMAPEAREFIDNVDSWTVDLTTVPSAVAYYLSTLRGAGLDAEIRVWRKP